MNLDTKTSSSIETALYWILGGALLAGFVALMVKYPKLARAVQTVVLIFITIETLTEFSQAAGPIRALIGTRPIRPISTGYRRSRRPEPGRSSTYQPGIPVQIIRASSVC
jgi:hypothetical protein